MKKKLAIILTIILCCMAFLSLGVHAASTSDAIEPIDTAAAGSLTVYYRHGELCFEGMEIDAYRVASVTSDFQYSATEKFAAYLDIASIESQADWHRATETLNAYIVADRIPADLTAKTDTQGAARFSNLELGMYLVRSAKTEQDGATYTFESVIIAVPNVQEDGTWLYDVEAIPKPGEDHPTHDYREFKVIKQWKGSGEKRPESVEIEIFKNGESVETQELSKENDWCYTWTAMDDGSEWSVVERNVPKGYTVSIEGKTDTFIVTNTSPEKPPEPPKTGDTSNIYFYLILLAGAGIGLVLLGVGMRRRTE